LATNTQALGQKLEIVELVLTSQINTLWVLICTCLIFLMQAGFMCLEAGIGRPKNTINIALKNITDLSVAVVSFWAIGFGLMFGDSVLGLFGSSYFFFTSDYGAYQVYFFYQSVFVATAVTIVSGPLAERTKFEGYIIIALIISIFVYPVVGHWGWDSLVISDLVMDKPRGWLVNLGFYDFAGSTIVHSVGGWAALAALIIIGPRTGRFNNTGNIKLYTSYPLAVLGLFLLWLGWFGFNAGSNGRLDFSVPLIMINTFAGGSAGLIVGVLYGYYKERKISTRAILIGPLAGLVSITASCNIISQASAMIIASVAAVLALKADELLERFKIDDIVGAVPVHLVSGVWGTLAVAFFADFNYGTFGDVHTYSFSFSPRTNLFFVQLTGVLSVGLFAFGTIFILLKIINRFYPLRVTAQEEELGLNIAEHGENTAELDLINFLKKQIDTKNLTLRTNQDPFTNFGIIGGYVNKMLDKLDYSDKEINKWRSRVLQEIRLATEVQKNFRPNRDLLNYPIYGHNVPARELSGDFFDIYPHNEIIYFIVADVAGKGINAAMVMAKSITLFETLAGNKHDIDEIAQKINNDLSLTKTRGMFVTAIIGKFNTENYEIEYVNAGHQTPLLKKNDDTYEDFDEEKLFPLGIADVNDPSDYKINKVNIKDKRFYIYTDGLSEIVDTNGEEVGSKGLQEIIVKNKNESLKKETEKVIRVLKIKQSLSGSDPGQVHDDMTLVSFGN
jgi:Amt family ammonium transporter